jgi:uncharacterized protein YjdB
MVATAVIRDDRNGVLLGRALTWTTSDAAVATVDGNGVITGVTLGKVTVTASAEGKSGSTSITVVPPPVQTVTVSVASPSFPQGTTTSAAALLQDDRGTTLAGRAVTWSSSATSVAIVDATGVVTGVAMGSAVITATSEGKSGSATVTVLPVPVATVTVSLAQSNILPGASTTASAVALDAMGNVLSGRAVTWSSSVSSVATVSATGVVQAVAFGTATITASVEGRIGLATLTVAQPVATVVFTGSLRQKVGDAYNVSVTARTADGSVVTRPVTWRIREVGRATVTSDGVVTPLQTGTYTLVAVIDGSEWSASYTTYDWDAFTSSGSSFLTIEADAQVSNKFGTQRYPILTAACSNTGTFFVWVTISHIVTANGIVAYSFDGGTPFAETWSELSPDFETLWKSGSNTVKKAFAMQIASASRFTFAFGEYQSVSRATTFRVSGLAGRLPTLIAQCPAALSAGGTVVLDSLSSIDELRRAASAVHAPTTQSAEARRRALSGPETTGSVLLAQWPVWDQPEAQLARKGKR